MKKKQLRVLSIDFDYFQKASAHTLMNCYPDGVDLESKVSEFVWMSHYAFKREELETVTIHKKHLREMAQIIKAQLPATPCLVAQSHIHCFDFIKEHYGAGKYSSCRLYNVDMHHDLFNDNEELDCGNWIGHLKEEIPTDVTWIANPISKKIYGLQEFDIIKEDLSVLKGKQFDLVFLCRSDAWLPPHLDDYFDDFLNLLCRTFDNVLGETQIREPRNLAEIYENAEAQRKFFENMKKKKR